MKLFLRVFTLTNLVWLFSSLAAQQTVHQCGSDLILKKLLQDPIQKKIMDAYEDTLFKIAHAHPASRVVDYTIPIVVHIIHNGGAENISDATVIQGIQDLNDAFANAGFYSQSEGVDVHVKFCLARQDENGLFSTGINRVLSALTNMTMETDNQAVKALSYWNSSKYLNIWLVNSINSVSIGPGVAAYATFPTSAGTTTDGILNEAQFFGSSQDNSKIHVHEAGHYLGLYHTFQNGCSNTNCLTDNDRICDTPPDNSVQPVNCNGVFNSCSSDGDDQSANNPFRSVALGGLGNQPDMFQNYMDYGYQPCQILFTAGQRERMISSLLNFRSTLLESNGCESPCPTPINAAFHASATPVNAGEMVSLINTSTGATNYTWFKNGIQFSTSQNPQLTFIPNGIYYITLVASNADSSCYTSIEDTIFVNCPITSSFTSSAVQITQGSSITFTKTGSGANQYSWFSGSTSIGNTPVLTHVFQNPGSYYITLQSSNGFCSVTSAGTLILVGNSCEGISAGPDIQACKGDTILLNADTLEISGDSLIWLGGTGVFLPGRNVYNPTYIPSPAELGTGRVDLFLKVIKRDSISTPASNLLCYDHYGEDSVFYISPFNGEITGVQSNSGHDWTAMGYRIADNKLYGISNIVYSPALYSIDMATNQVNMIASYGPDFYAGDYDNSHDIFYAVGIPSNNTGMQTLYKINALDGALSPVGVLGITGTNTGMYAGGDGINGLGYDPSVDILYGVSFSGKLYSVNISTGLATFIGNTQSGLRGLTYDFTTNKLWGVSNSTNLYELDKSTGVVLSTVTTQGAFNYATSLAFAPDELVLNNQISCGDSLRIFLNNNPEFSFGPDRNRCDSNAIELAVSTDYSDITWQDGSHAESFSVTQAGIYSAVISDSNGCAASDTIEVFGEIAGTGFNLGNDTAICSGMVMTLEAPPGFQQYEWFDYSAEQVNTVYGPGTYWLKVTDGCGNEFRDTLNIQFVLSAKPNLGPDTSICGEQNLILDAGAGFINYNWQSNQTEQTLTVSMGGNFWVRTENSEGCFGYDTISVNYLQGTSIIDLGPDKYICKADSVVLEVGNGFTDYIWQDGSNAQHYITQIPGIYHVRAKGLNGCWAGDSISLQIANTPEVNLGNDTLTCLPIYLHADNYFSSYLWNTGMTSEKIRVDSSGTYWVLVSDSNLCNSSDSIHVEFKKEGGEINVPNVFSPNGDLINDLLEVNVDFVEDYLLQIYTRWGQKVLETSQVTEFWDGGDLPEGTYYYIVKYLDQCNGISKLKKGSVTLLR